MRYFLELFLKNNQKKFHYLETFYTFVASEKQQDRKKMKQYSLSEMEDKYIGKIGTPERDKYEYELRRKLLSLKADIRFNVQLENKSIQLI